MASLKDKVILITGAGDESGIGAATALHMIQFGPRFVLTGRRQEKLDIVGKLMEDAGVCKDRLLLVVADVTIDADQERLVKSAIDKFQQLDVVIHNAGITAYHKTMDTSMEEFDLVMRTNLRAPFYLSKLCLPYLIKTKGNIVNVSSISGQRTLYDIIFEKWRTSSNGITPDKDFNAQLGLRTKLCHDCRLLLEEMAEHGVRVNSVNPGVIRTNIQQKGGMSSQQYAEYIERQKLKHPLGNIGEPIDVAKAITFLSSEDSSFITGELIFVDGGRHSHPV